jgi:hypothetical protein
MAATGTVFALVVGFRELVTYPQVNGISQMSGQVV